MTGAREPREAFSHGGLTRRVHRNTTHVDQLVHARDIHVVVSSFLPDRYLGPIAIGISVFHRILLPDISVFQLEQLTGLEPLKMPGDPGGAYQASHRVTLRAARWNGGPEQR